MAIHVLNSKRKQNNAVSKNLRDINRIVEKIGEKESKVVFGKVARKQDMCVIGVSDASYLGLEQGRKINMVSMFRVSDLELVVSIYNP